MLTIYGVIREVLLHYNNPSAYDLLEEIEVFVVHNLSDVAAGVAAPLFTILYLFFMDFSLPL